MKVKALQKLAIVIMIGGLFFLLLIASSAIGERMIERDTPSNGKVILGAIQMIIFTAMALGLGVIFQILHTLGEDIARIRGKKKGEPTDR